jgi:hypothetical protein
MSDEFQTKLREAADKAVEKQLEGVKHHLRQAFYDGVAFQMERQREQLNAGRKPT